MCNLSTYTCLNLLVHNDISVGSRSECFASQAKHEKEAEKATHAEKEASKEQETKKDTLTEPETEQEQNAGVL